MNEIEMYAMYGKKQAELDVLNEQYNLLLSVLAQVASGEVHPQRVTVDLPGRRWEVAPQAVPVVQEAQEPTVQ